MFAKVPSLVCITKLAVNVYIQNAITYNKRYNVYAKHLRTIISSLYINYESKLTIGTVCNSLAEVESKQLKTSLNMLRMFVSFNHSQSL